MSKKLFIPAALTLAAASAALLGACKANDTAGGAGTSQAALKTGTPAQQQPSAAPKAPDAPTGTTTVAADGVRRINVAELQKMVEEGRVAIYDTRSKASYEQEHIKDALSMPQNEAAGRASEFPRDKTLVFYCT